MPGWVSGGCAPLTLSCLSAAFIFMSSSITLWATWTQNVGFVRGQQQHFIFCLLLWTSTDDRAGALQSMTLFPRVNICISELFGFWARIKKAWKATFPFQTYRVLSYMEWLLGLSVSYYVHTNKYVTCHKNGMIKKLSLSDLRWCSDVIAGRRKQVLPQ